MQKLARFTPCLGISFGDALKMIVAIEVLYFLGYILHGSYLLAAVSESHYVFGAIYIICGLYCVFLIILSWQISNEPTSGRCYLWVGNSILIQLIVFILTVSRFATGNRWRLSDLVWILLCGFLLQCYFCWVIFVYAKSFNCDFRDDPMVFAVNAETARFVPQVSSSTNAPAAIVSENESNNANNGPQRMMEKHEVEEVSV